MSLPRTIASTSTTGTHIERLRDRLQHGNNRPFLSKPITARKANVVPSSQLGGGIQGGLHSTYYSSSTCQAQQLGTGAVVTERMRTLLVQQLERGGVQLEQLLDSLDTLSTEELLAVATCIPSLPSPPSSSSMVDQGQAATSNHRVQQLALVLRMLQARNDVGQCLHGDGAMLATLCQLLHMSCSTPTTHPLAAAEACISARLRWPGLVHTVMQLVPSVLDNLSHEELAHVLAAIGACSSSGYVPCGTLLPLLHALFSSNADRAAASEGAVAAGMNAVIRLAPYVGQELQPELQACFEDALVQLAQRVHALQPSTVELACEASAACGCVPPVEWVTAVLRQAASATPSHAAEWSVAVGLLLPHVGTTPGAQPLLQDLLQRLLFGSGQEEAALVLLDSASHVHWQADAAQHTLVGAALQCGSVRMQAAALRCLAAHGSTPAECEALLERVAAAVDTTPAAALVDAAIACAQMGEHGMAAGDAITARLSTMPVTALTDSTVTAPQLLALAATYSSHLEDTQLSQPDTGSQVANVALAALAALPPSRLTLAPHHSSPLAAWTPNASMRAAGHLAHQLSVTLAGLGRERLVRSNLWTPMQAVLMLSAQAVAWQQPGALVDQLWELQPLGPALWRGLNVRGTRHGAAGGAAFLRVAQLGLWMGVDAAAGPGAQDYDGEPDSVPVMHGSSGLSVGQMVRVMRVFGTLEWRPGQQVKDITLAMQDALAVALEHGTLVAGVPEDAAGSGGGGRGDELSLSQALWVAWGLAKVRQRTGSAQAYVRLCVQATLEALGQGPGAAAGSKRPRAVPPVASSQGRDSDNDSPLASTWDSEAKMDRISGASGARSKGRGLHDPAPPASSPASPTQLAVLLWSAAGVGLAGDARLVPLFLALRKAAPQGIPLRHLSSVVWASARLGVGGAALASWAEACATQMLQAEAAQHDSGIAAASAPPSGAAHTDAHADDGRSRVSTGSLANLAWGLQAMGWQPSQPFISALAAAASVRMHMFKPQELTAMCVALVQWTGGPGTYRGVPQAVQQTQAVQQAGVGRGSPPEGGPVEGNDSMVNSPGVLELLHAVAHELHARMAAFDAPAAAYLAWALARAGLRLDHQLLGAVASKLRMSPVCLGSGASDGCSSSGSNQSDSCVPRHVDDQLLCSFLWAASVCGHRPAELLSAYCAALPARLARKQDADTKADMASAAAFALGACGHRNDAVLAALTDVAVRVDDAMTPFQLSSFLYGCAVLGHCPHQWWRRGLWGHLRRAIPQMSLPELVHALWALGQWPVDALMEHWQLEEVRKAARPVLLVHVLGAQVSATASASSIESAVHGPGSSSGTPSGSSSSMSPSAPDAQQQTAGSSSPAGAGAGAAASERQQPPRKPPTLPPISPALTADLAVGLSSLGIYAPDLADAVASWAVLQPGGGLARFSSKQLVSLLWAFATWRHDALELFEGAAEVLIAREGSLAAAGLQQPTSSAPSEAAGQLRSPGAKQAAAATAAGKRGLSVRDCHKLLWAFAKFNRHPGAELLDAVRHVCEHAAKPPADTASASAASASAGQDDAAAVASLLPLDAVCTILYSLAIMREHRCPLASLLAAQLAAADASPAGPLHTQHQFVKQAPQLAACMLAAAAEGQASPVTSTLSAEARDLALGAWRARVAKRAGMRPGGYIKDVQRLLLRMGPANMRPHVPTPDGAALPDITLQLPTAPGLRFALEMVGSHNSAANSGRLLGDAALKYRLLQARGYLVVPVSCKEWDRMGPREPLTKMLYLQSKLEKRMAALAATTSSAPTAAASDASQQGIGQQAQDAQPSPQSQDGGTAGSAAAATAPVAGYSGQGAAMGSMPLASVSSLMSVDGGDAAASDVLLRRQAPKRLSLSSGTSSGAASYLLTIGAELVGRTSSSSGTSSSTGSESSSGSGSRVEGESNREEGQE